MLDRRPLSKFRHPSQVQELTDVEWAYIAGFIDGEGCIQSRLIGSYSRVAITISQKDKRVILWLRSKLGGNLIKFKASKSGSDHWRLTLSRMNTVEEVLNHILPHLKVKREQALVARAITRTSDKRRTLELADLLSRLKRHEWAP